MVLTSHAKMEKNEKYRIISSRLFRKTQGKKIFPLCQTYGAHCVEPITFLGEPEG
jgi:hypothetical protein